MAAPEQSSPSKERVLLTGASGRIGTSFRRFAGERYRLRLGTRDGRKLGDTGGHEVCEFDVADLAACREACRGIDVVVHLAGVPSPLAEFYDTLLEANIKGTYNIFRAAADQGCRRVVYASSVQAVDGYPVDVQVRTDSPVQPMSMYGVSKCFGEAVACCFALAEGLSCIAVRIGRYEGNPGSAGLNAHNLSKSISRRDMNQLLVRCIEVPDVRFAIVHGVSDNRFKRLDLTSTRALLGYEPEDDAFNQAGLGLDYSDPRLRRG